MHVQDAMTQYNEAIEQIDRQEYGRAEEALREVLSKLADSEAEESVTIRSAASNNLGNLMMMQGRYGESKEFFEEAIALNPNHALALNNLGTVLMKEGNSDQAIEYFKRAIQRDPALSLAYYNLGEIYLKMGLLRKSAEYLFAHLRLDPANINAFLNLIKIYELSELPEQREDAWNTMIQVAGDDTDKLTYIVSRMIDQGSMEHSRDELLAVIKSHPDSPELLAQQARIYLLESNWSEAKTLLDSLLANDSDNPTLLGYMAVALLNLDDISAANRTIGKALAIQEDHADNQFVQGAILQQQHEYERARKAYESVLRTESGHTHAMNNLGVLATLDNDAETAVKWFERALDADPLNQEAEYNLGRTLVLSQKDYRRGVLMLTQVGARPGPNGERARKFIADLEVIAGGGDPGWAENHEAVTSSPM